MWMTKIVYLKQNKLRWKEQMEARDCLKIMDTNGLIFKRNIFKVIRNLFIIINPKSKEILNFPIGYTPNIQEYLDWLKDGIGKFEK